MDDSDGMRWGRLAKGLYKGNVSYSSFFYEGTEYELYDNVFLYVQDAPEPDIGKIVTLWEEKKTKRRRMLIRWFLKPSEFLKLDFDSDPKELFLAYGAGRGVTNENDLEAIIGKCNVLCTSKDLQNIQPSESDLKEADYFFYRVYDVDQQQFYNVERVVRKLGYKQVYNKPSWVSREAGVPFARNVVVSSVGTSIQREVITGKTCLMTGIPHNSKRKATSNQDMEDDRRTPCLPSEATKRPREFENIYEDREEVSCQETDHKKQDVESGGLKRRVNEGKGAMIAGASRGTTRRISSKLSVLPSRSSGLSDGSMPKGDIQKKDKPQNTADETARSTGISKTSKLAKLNEFCPGGREKSAPKAMGIGSRVLETKIASSGTMKEAGKQILAQHFSDAGTCKRPWEENLLQGLQQERVLILQNLNPLLTSMDIYDMLKHIFKGFMDAQMVPQDGTLPFGQALVIFENKSSAESALQDLEEYCLVQTDDNRPLVASMATPPSSSRVARFPGHFPLQNFRLLTQQQESEKNVPASHRLQSNSVEFEMAMEWRYLQETVLKCWNSLHKNQMDEIKEVVQKLNQKHMLRGSKT